MEVSDSAMQSRPLSSLSLECVHSFRDFSFILMPMYRQYAYKGSDDQGYTPPTLTHAQSAPRAFQRFQPQISQPRAQMSVSQATDAIPSSSRFKPPGPPASSSRNNAMGQFNQLPADMGPPPTPQQTMNVPAATYLPPASRQQTIIPSTSSGQRPIASASTPQRFFPNGILPPNSRSGAIRPNNNNNSVTGRQRLPFV
jgi:hypothetical protein